MGKMYVFKFQQWFLGFKIFKGRYCLTSIIASGRDQTFVDLQLKFAIIKKFFFIQ